MAKLTAPADAILGLTKSVSHDWTKQRKAEERSANAAAWRSTRLMRSERITKKDAAFHVMEEAYDKASAGGTLPVNPRQIYYAARRSILLATGADDLESGYFLQTLPPQYMNEYDCDDWDLIWESREHFTEPHTGLVVPIGTLQVREYVGDRPKLGDPVEIDAHQLYPTKGPEHRYNTVLFVEKDGFDPIFDAARIAARFDVAIMSTKGMSTTSARLLLDRLVDRGVEKILVLHDFDISGFSICGTLGTDSGRYTFANDVPLIDIGLRLSNIDELGLLHEPFSTNKNPHSVAYTLRRHGATDEEIDFLMQESEDARRFEGERVELNAMTSDELVAFIERKFAEHGVSKIIPTVDVLEQHARRMLERHTILRELDKLILGIREQVAETTLPENLRTRVTELLEESLELPWDAAVAAVMSDDLDDGDAP